MITALRSASPTQGTAKEGSPCGSWPSTFTPAVAARSKTPTAIVAAATAIRMAEMRRKRLRTRITAKVPALIMNVVQLASPPSTSRAIRQTSRNGPALSIEMPNIFGSWLISTVSAMPFMYP